MPPTPGQPTKEPMVIPLALGLVGKNGDLPLHAGRRHAPERGVLVLDKPAQTFTFTGVAEPPVLSINRGFSAPIKLDADLIADDLRVLAAHDSDPFNRWQAVQTLATALLTGNVARLRAGQDPEADEGLLEALAAILADRLARARLRRRGAAPAGRSRHRARDRPRRRSRRDLPRPHRPARAGRAASQRRADRDLSQA